MASIEEYRQDVNKYYALKDKITRIIRELDSAAQSAESLENEVASNFKVNNDTAKLAGRVGILDNGLLDTSSFLRNTILPSIDDAITNTNSEISRLEAEERRRQEEEERKRKEEEEARLREEEMSE